MNKFVFSMALLRFISGSIEVLAGLWMLRLNQVDRALAINAGLALIGPLILISTNSIGLIGLSYKLSYGKLVWVALGVSFILFGVFKK